MGSLFSIFRLFYLILITLFLLKSASVMFVEERGMCFATSQFYRFVVC
jgi:hypothetical protein